VAAEPSAPTPRVRWSEAGGQRVVPAEFRMPLAPMAGSRAQDIGQSRFGIALNGVLFDPAGRWWPGRYRTGWQFEAMSERIRHYIGLDASNGHVQPSGAYHYHGVPERYVKLLAKNAVAARSAGVDTLLLVGWAADGFPIYRPFVSDTAAGPLALSRELRSSYRLKSGLRPRGVPLGSYDGTLSPITNTSPAAAIWTSATASGWSPRRNFRTGPMRTC
jgi:hypothetical protein